MANKPNAIAPTGETLPVQIPPPSSLLQSARRGNDMLRTQESNAKLLQLEVRVDNPKAKACYRKFGFEFSNHRIMVNRLINRLIPPQP